jgi:hypothetical protein
VLGLPMTIYASMRVQQRGRDAPVTFVGVGRWGGARRPSRFTLA